MIRRQNPMKMEAETTESTSAAAFNACGVCKESFKSREPKLLPCLHTFCRSCVLSEAGDATVKCPMCSQECVLGEMIDNQFVTDMEPPSATSGGGANNSMDEKPRICTGCEENTVASSFCLDCSEWLCMQCVQAHRRVRITKDHTIEAKENVACNRGPAKDAQSTLYCPLHHHELLKLFCETCDKLTCRDCQLLEHKEHKYQFIEEASIQYRVFLQTLLSKIKEKRAYINNAKSLINRRYQEIETREKAVLEDIKTYIRKLNTEVTNRGKRLVMDLHSVCGAKKSQLGQKQTEIVALSSRLDHALKFAAYVLQHGNKAAILYTKKVLLHQLREVLRTRCEVPNPYHKVDIKLQYDENFLNVIPKQGLLNVDGVQFPGVSRGMSSRPSSVATAGGSGSSGSGQPPAAQMQQSQGQGQASTPAGTSKIPGRPPPNLSTLNTEQRALLMKRIAQLQINQKHHPGSNSPTSSISQPGFPTRQQGAAVGQHTPVSLHNHSNGNHGNQRLSHFTPVPQSNTVSSTQAMKTGGVYFPPSSMHGHHLHRNTSLQQHQFHQHHQQQMANLVQMDNQRSQRMTQLPQHQQQGSLGTPSMVNAIVIQPASSSGPYTPMGPQSGGLPPGVASSRDQMTPSPRFRLSPASLGSRNEVSPVESIGEIIPISRQDSSDSGNPSSSAPHLKQETMDYLSSAAPPDGAFNVKSEPRTPSLDPAALSFPSADMTFDAMCDALNMHQRTSFPLDSGLDPDGISQTGNATPPPSAESPSNQELPYNLCKPITDQVKEGQSGQAILGVEQVLDLSSYGSSANGSRKAGGSGSSASDGTGSRAGSAELTLCPQGYSQTLLSTLQADGISKTSPRVAGVTLPEPLPFRDPDDPSEDYCAVCHNGGELLCCDTCPKVFHLTCHVPSLYIEPSGAWSCGLCKRNQRIEAPEPSVSDTMGTKRKAVRELVDRELEVCERILLELFCHEASPPFHEPVPKSVPNYHKIITSPMDLGTIKQKLSHTFMPYYYTSIDDYLADVQLVFTNCSTFNDPTSEVGKAGKLLEEFFDQLVHSYLPYVDLRSGTPNSDTSSQPKVKRRRKETGSKEGKDIRGHREAKGHQEAKGHLEVKDHQEAKGYLDAKGHPEVKGHQEAKGLEVNGHQEVKGHLEVKGHEEAKGHLEVKDREEVKDQAELAEKTGSDKLPKEVRHCEGSLRRSSDSDRLITEATARSRMVEGDDEVTEPVTIPTERPEPMEVSVENVPPTTATGEVTDPEDPPDRGLAGSADSATDRPAVQVPTTCISPVEKSASPPVEEPRERTSPPPVTRKSDTIEPSHLRLESPETSETSEKPRDVLEPSAVTSPVDDPIHYD